MKATTLLVCCGLAVSLLGYGQSEPLTAPKPAATVASPQNPSVPVPPNNIKGVASQPGDPNRIQPILIGPLYHTKADYFDKIDKYPWRYVPRGEREFCNVPLHIGGMICLWGASNAKGGLVFPQEQRGIPVGRKFTSLYLYHPPSPPRPLAHPSHKWSFATRTAPPPRTTSAMANMSGTGRSARTTPKTCSTPSPSWSGAAPTA